MLNSVLVLINIFPGHVAMRNKEILCAVDRMCPVVI